MYLSNMKSLIIFCCILFFSAAEVFSQNQFQGKVTFQVTENGKTENISYFVKGNKFKIQPTQADVSGMGEMIYDADKKVMIVLMKQQKMYMEMPLDMSDEMSNDNSTDYEYFIKTGESKEIKGYTCDQFKFKDGNKTGFAWMTKDLGPFLFMGNPEGGNKSQSKWQKEIMEEGYFPMLVEEETSNGKLNKVFEIIDLKPMVLEDDVFSIPAGFSKFSMPNMMDKNK